jgi:hypothetical protein
MRSVHAIVAIALVACGPKADEVVQQLVPAATARLAEYRDAVRTALAAPTPVELTLSEKLVLGGDDDAAVNAAVIHREWIEEDPQKRHSDNEVISETGNDFHEVASHTSGRHAYDNASPDPYRRMFKRFMGYRYLVVVDGTVSGGLVEAESYTGGGFTGRLIFIDVAKKAPIGMVRVESGMPEGTNVVLNHAHSVDRQLRFQASKLANGAVFAALEPYLAPSPGK